MRKHNQSGTPPDALEDLPPSAKLVYKTLELNGRLTQRILAEKTRLATRTTRYAVRQLEERGIITSEPCLTDARMQVYSLETE